MSRQSNNSSPVMFETLEERRMMSVASFGTSLIRPEQPTVIRIDQSIVVDAKLARADQMKKNLEAGQIASTKSQIGQSVATKSSTIKNNAESKLGKNARPTQTSEVIKLDQPSVNPFATIGAGRANKGHAKPDHHAKPKPAPKPARPHKPRRPHYIQNPAVYYPAAVQGPAQNPDYGDDSQSYDPAPTDPGPIGPVNEPNASGAANWIDEYGNPLFGTNGPSPDDIFQGGAADCYFLATLSSVARTDPGLIEQDISSLGGGNYQVVFYNNGAPVDEVVDGYLPVDANNNLMYAQLGQQNDIWVPILEKAFAIYRSDVNGLSPDYANINYGVAEEVFADLGATNINTLAQSDVPDGPTLFNDASQELAAGQAVTFETPNDPNAGPLISNHLYSVVSVYQNDDGSYGLELRNPYGNDGPNSDGYNWIDADTAQAQLFDLASANV